jgi:aspartate racemase
MANNPLFSSDNSIGIVGGLGPETSARFYRDLASAFRVKGLSPRITLDNVAFPLMLEEQIIKRSINERILLPYLEASIARLNNSGVSSIVIPCNTAHLFINQLMGISNSPIISILDETAEAVRKTGLRTVGILSSAPSIKMYEKKLLENKVSVIMPSREGQELVSDYILGLLNGKKQDSAIISSLAEDMKEKGAEAIVLACTDLGLGLDKADFSLPVIDSYDALLGAAIRALDKKTFLKQ